MIEDNDVIFADFDELQVLPFIAKVRDFLNIISDLLPTD
jgi:hypothetical protein